MQKKNELTEIRNLIFRYAAAWKWFALSLSGSLLLAFLFIRFVTPVYRVDANILIKEDEPTSGNARGSSLMKSLGGSFGFPGSMDVQDELHILASFSVMRQVVDSLQLHIDYQERNLKVFRSDRYGNSAFTLTLPQGMADTLQHTFQMNIQTDAAERCSVKLREKKSGLSYSVREKTLPLTISTPHGDFRLEKSAFFEPGKSYDYRIGIYGLDEMAEYYMEEVDFVLVDKKANIISLSVKGPHVGKSKDILNTTIFFYNRDALDEKNRLALNTSNFIESRLSLLSRELNEAESRVERFKQENRLFDMELEAKVMLEQNSDLQKMMLEVGTQYELLEQIEAYLHDPVNRYELLPTTLGITEEQAVKAVESYNQVLLERLRLLRTTSSDNPVIINLEQQIGALRKSVLLSISNVKEGYAMARNELQKRTDLFMQRFGEAPQIEKQFMGIKRTQLIKEQLVLFLMEKSEETAMTLAVTAPKARIVDAAFRRNKAVFPKIKIVLAVALFLGLLLPVVAIFLLDLLRNTFVSREELEQLTTVPVLGEVGIHDNGSAVAVTADAVTSIAEMFRLIRTNLQFILTRQEEKVLLITSTHSGEGKSFFSINLALSLALTRKKVLLIGLDIRNPKLLEYMKVDDNLPGITNYLVDHRLTLSDIRFNSSLHPCLDIIGSGPIPPNPGELLLEKRLDDLLSSCREHYDYILIDSAPVGMVSDTFSLDRLSDMTIYVVRANCTERTHLPFIEHVNVSKRLKKLYLILNGTKAKKGYGYGYASGAKASK